MHEYAFGSITTKRVRYVLPQLTRTRREHREVPSQSNACKSDVELVYVHVTELLLAEVVKNQD